MNEVFIEDICLCDEWEEQQCIEIDDPRGLYVTDNGLITHNSTSVLISNLFCSTHLALMYHPWKFFALAPSTIFCNVFVGSSQKAVSQLLTEPFSQFLEQCDFYRKVRSHDAMIASDLEYEQEEYVSHLSWTTAAVTSALQISNNQNYKLISSANALLGQNICHGNVTEIGFMKEAPGWTDERINKVFTKLRGRITSRMKGSYYGRIILDSSPGSKDDDITNWIFDEAPKSKLNKVVIGSRWHFFPEEFPKFIPDKAKPKETKNNFEVAFPLYQGGKGKVAQVVQNESQLEQYDSVDIIWCPKESITHNGVASHIDMALESPRTYLQDYCGVPLAQNDRIFYDSSVIEKAFDNQLRNIYGCIECPALEDPEHLIWDQIKHLFFYQIFDKYRYYYHPEVQRVLTVDSSESQDMACIAVSHNEFDPLIKDSHTGQPAVIHVTDFTIYITPKAGLVNLDSIRFFIQDLRVLGGLNIRHHSFDGFEARTTRQYLTRMAYENEYLSVDRDNTPYMSFINSVFDGRWHCGKNIFLKNNLKALYMSKRKISGSTKVDHFIGDLIYDYQGPDQWATCQAGKFAKDGSDAIAGNIALLNQYANEFVPFVEYKPIETNGRTPELVKEYNQKVMDKMRFIT